MKRISPIIAIVSILLISTLIGTLLNVVFYKSLLIALSCYLQFEIFNIISAVIKLTFKKYEDGNKNGETV